MTWLQWVQIIEIPVLAALGRFAWRGHQAAGDVRHELSEFKLEVAKEYTSIAHLKDVERRLLTQLEKIETKLDRAILASTRRSSSK